MIIFRAPKRLGVWLRKTYVSNGFRYLNWLIDVPMLLIQILFVVELSKKMRDSVRVQFFISGTLMILTGYIGQFYEVTNTTALLVWGGISTLFFLHVLYLMRRVINEGRQSLPQGASRIMGSIWWLFLISLVAIPHRLPDAGAVERRGRRRGSAGDLHGRRHRLQGRLWRVADHGRADPQRS